jgi:hypothetical protein
MFYNISTWGQFYKTFILRNQNSGQISWTVCPWQAFTTWGRIHNTYALAYLIVAASDERKVFDVGTRTRRPVAGSDDAVAAETVAAFGTDFLKA